MANRLKYKGYYGSVEFSEEDGLLYGKLLHLSNALVNYEAKTVPEIAKSFKAAVDDYLATCKAQGIEPQKPFKGTFNVRTGTKRHEQAVIAAQQCGIKSLNDFVNQAIDHELDRLKAGSG